MTGTLTAEEQADVAAETGGPRRRDAGRARHAGRRGRRARSHLVRPKPRRSSRRPRPTRRRSRRGSASPPTRPFDVNAVPEVPEREGVASSWRRASSTASSRCSTSASSRSRSSTSGGRRWRRRGSSTRRRRTAPRSSISRCRRRARASTLARKALADTVVRAPFDGVVAERLVSVGDYVTSGMKVAVVVRDQSAARAS